MPAQAQSDTSGLVDINKRMAVAVRTTDHLFTRVWAVTSGRWLVSKLPEANISGWYYADIGADSGIASLDRTEGSTQRQRVYYSRYGTMWELNYDGDSYHSRTMLPAAPSGTSFTNGAVAATQWDDSSGHHTAVGAIASNGRVCVWEGSFAAGYQAAQCTTTGVAYQYSPDISAASTYDASGNGTPAFFYRRADYHLGARIRTPIYFSYYWPGLDLGVPSGSSYIYPSVAAVRSVALPDRFEVIVSANGQLRAARVTTGGSVSWLSIPTLPNTATVAYKTTALSVTPYTYYQWPAGYVSPLALFVVGSDNALYRVASTSSGAWTLGWQTGAAGAAATPLDQSWLSNGVAVAEGLSWSQTPVVWGSGGSRPGATFSGTLQKFTEAAEFDDHLNYFHYQQQILGRNGTSRIATTEGTTSVSGQQGLTAGIRRNTPPPWEIGIADTNVGGANWSDDEVVGSASDPYTAIERDSGRMHLATLEAEVSTVPALCETSADCRAGDTCDGSDGTQCATAPSVPCECIGMTICSTDAQCAPGGICDAGHCVMTTACHVDGNSQRVIYRRGWSAAAIAALDATGPDLYQIHAGQGWADHESMTLTQQGGQTTVHILFNQLSGLTPGLKLWTLPPSGAPTEVPVPDLIPQPPGIFSDAAGTVYGWSEVYDSTQTGNPSPLYPWICKLNTSGQCVDMVQTVAPPSAGNVASPIVHFSLEEPIGSPESGCVTRPFLNTGGGSYRQIRAVDWTRNCFQTAESFSFVADPLVPNRIYAVYQGMDDSRGSDAVSVYFTMHAEGAGMGMWSAPVRVNASAPASNWFIDPEITVDNEGTIIVSYTEVEDDMDGNIGRPNYVAWSTDSGTTFQNQTLWDTWKPWDLPYHCGREIHFLGEYEHPSVIGGRAFHNSHVSVSNQVIRGGFLASRWAIRN